MALKLSEGWFYCCMRKIGWDSKEYEFQKSEELIRFDEERL
jgi:hypothetical protein